MIVQLMLKVKLADIIFYIKDNLLKMMFIGQSSQALPAFWG
jgi:hypothetical protein